MTNRYPLWKYLILVIALVAGILYALPNLFGVDPALQIATENGALPPEPVRQQVVERLESEGIRVKGTEIIDGRYLVRLYSTEAQLRAADVVALELGNKYTIALTLAPSTPGWLRAINAKPMNLGLDLQGGIHFLMQVDLEAAVQQVLERTLNEFRTRLRQKGIRYTGITLEDERIEVAFNRASEREQALQFLSDAYPGMQFEVEKHDGRLWLAATLSKQRQTQIENRAVEQNITTLRHRVNELGVAEPLIQRQGHSRIVVELPGVRNPARAKKIIGTTATLEFHLVDQRYFPFAGGPDVNVPPGSEVYPRKDGGYIVLKERTIITGEYIVGASSTIDSRTGLPVVTISLSGAGGDIMHRVTSRHVKDYMAVVFIETETQARRVNGEVKRVQTRVREVISVAQIQEPLGSHFRITGLESAQAARDLALLLRAGSLAAPIKIIGERTIGPSLGEENIEQGFLAAAVSFLVVAVFLALYYRVFGLFADAALLANLIFIVAILSLLQATLTLPGIAGIALSIAMAVDANVLIYERIREELRAGASAQAAIAAGYDRAFSAIFDGNITVLMAAVLLFVFGTGPIKGFAVTLSIGVAASMFTAIMGTRALTNLVYGGRRGVRLQI